MNKIHKTNRKKIVFICFTCFFLYCLISYFYEHTFIASRWIEQPQSRVKMVDDMLSKHTLINMTQDEVTTLLGKETETAYFQEKNTMVYYLGNERGLISIDSEWLVLELENGIITGYSIKRD